MSKILDNQQSVGRGFVIPTSKLKGGEFSFHAIADGSSGPFSAVVRIDVSNDPTEGQNKEWIVGDPPAIRFTLSGTSGTPDNLGAPMIIKWDYISAYVESISGTGAFVDMYMGV